MSIPIRRDLGLVYTKRIPDANRIGTKSDTIRFTSVSDPLHFSPKVSVYTKRKDSSIGQICANALHGPLQQATAFPSFRSLRKVSFAIFLVQ